jgi:hypothetical protein
MLPNNAQLERSFRTAIEDMKQSQKERRQQHAQSPQPGEAKQTASAAQPDVQPPPYVMSEGTEAHPVFCAPVSPDTR